MDYRHIRKLKERNSLKETIRQVTEITKIIRKPKRILKVSSQDKDDNPGKCLYKKYDWLLNVHDNSIHLV